VTDKDKKVCPIMTTDDPEVSSDTECLEDKCALWVEDMKCCCYVMQANTLYLIVEELRRLNGGK